MARTQLNPAADQGELLPVEIPPAARHPKVRMITRSEIFPDPEQPRQKADAELRDSLARNGMLQPITVRRHPSMVAGWMIVDGERRWRSAEGVLNDLPCIVREDMEELPRRLATQLEANTGKSLTPLEEARAFGKLLEETGSSVSDLAKLLGRAPSTIAERVALLELGPWLPLIESGEVVMSHAVKVLLPLRTVPDDVHEQVIPKVQADYRWGKKGGGSGISLGDFQSLVETYYRPSMYPLAKTKGYGKQPEFNTSKHDAECGCGGIKFDLGNGSARLCCGNPGWWRPLHRAALKAKKPKGEKREAPRGKALYMPPGTPTVKSSYGDMPKGVVRLTDSRGEWGVNPHDDQPFDPADLQIDEKKLVLLTSNYGSDFPSVGTKDVAAVKRARARWTERWDAELGKLRDELGARLVVNRAKYAIGGGAGAPLILAMVVDRETAAAVVDIAEASELAIPKQVLEGNRWNLDARLQKWVGELSPDDASLLLTGLATLLGEKLASPTARVQELQHRAIEGIRKQVIPWRAKPKAETPPKGAKAKAGAKKQGKKAASKLPLSKLSTETAELPLADDPLATFRDEEAELTLADERAAEGAFDDDDDESTAVYDDGDDLWDDAGDDELEEAAG